MFTNPNLRNLIAEVSTPTVRVFGEGNPTKIVAVDTGIKYNMIRHLCARGCEVKLVPWNHKFSEETYDGLFLSNGPGDPSTVPEVVAELQRVIHGDGENSENPYLAFAWAIRCWALLLVPQHIRCHSATAGKTYLC